MLIVPDVKAYAAKEKKPRPSFAWVGPAALAVFVYAGQLQASPLLSWFPASILLATIAVGVAAFIAARVKNGPGTWAVALPPLLWVVFFLGIYQASFDEYTSDKLQTLYTVTLFAAIAPFHLLRTPSQRRAFLIAMGVVTLLAGVLTLMDPNAGNGAVTLDGTNTIGTARIAGTGALIFFVLAVVLKDATKRLMCVGASVALLAVLIAVGSRGPFLGIMVGIIGVLVLSPVLKRRRFAGIFWSVALAATAFWWATQQTFYGSNRAFAWLSGERDNSTDTREYMWNVSWQNIAWEPAGIGWGDFANHEAASGTLIRYPHNLFLEVFYEAGWIAGGALLLFVIASLLLMWKRSYEPATAVLFALLLFSLVNAMVSGDINDNRLMWLLLSCAWVLPAQEKQLADEPAILPVKNVKEKRQPKLPKHYQQLQGGPQLPTPKTKMRRQPKLPPHYQKLQAKRAKADPYARLRQPRPGTPPAPGQTLPGTYLPNGHKGPRT